MPFVQTGPDDTPASFTPVLSQIVQYDVPSFQYSVLLKLLRDETYKILVLGYNSADYDHNNPSGGSNKFEITAWMQPPTLQTITLSFFLEQSPDIYYSCEIFSGFAQVGENDSFVVTDDMIAVCVLQRLQCGLSLEVTDIPSNVESITLKTSGRAWSVSPYYKEGMNGSVTGTGAATIPLASRTISGGTATLDIYLIPYTDPAFAIDLIYTDSSTATYPVTATYPETGETLDIFPIVANQAYNLSGSYNDFKFVINVGPSLGLDDDQWDGYN